jgi:hypothetical protein
MNNLPNIGGCRMLGMVWCGGMKPVGNANNGGPGVECGGSFQQCHHRFRRESEIGGEGVVTNNWLARRLGTLSGSTWVGVIIAAG